MTRRLIAFGAAAVVVSILSSCGSHQIPGSPKASTPLRPTSSGPTAAAAPCALPHFGDLIEWQRQPGRTDNARRLSDVDEANCAPALNNWLEGMPPGPGVCYMIGWASDNPDYNANALPAPPLKKVIDKVGDAC